MHRAPRTSRACLQLSLLPLLLLASACHGPLNDANGLYGSTPLPALGEPVQQRPMLSEENSGVAPLDRSQWPLQTIQMQAAQVEHQPTFRKATPIVASSERASGDWPTVQSAVSTDINNGNAFLDGTLQPLGAGIDILLLPVRAIMQPPSTVVMGGPNQTDMMHLPSEEYAIPWRWVEPEQEYLDDPSP